MIIQRMEPAPHTYCDVCETNDALVLVRFNTHLKLKLCRACSEALQQLLNLWDGINPLSVRRGKK